MDRRTFLAGLFGVAGAAAIAAAVPRRAEALTGGLTDEFVPRPDVLPEAEAAAEQEEDGIEVAQRREWYPRRHRRRWRRGWRRHRRYGRRFYRRRRRYYRRHYYRPYYRPYYRRYCGWYRDRWGRLRRSCRRPYWWYGGWGPYW